MLQEWNVLDHHVTDIKEEYVNQSPDLVSEVKCEKDPVENSFPKVKREREVSAAQGMDSVFLCFSCVLIVRDATSLQQCLQCLLLNDRARETLITI